MILNTPTGSGKSLVASAFLFKALCAGQRAVYTCPIKALVNEKFLSLCREFGPQNVGLMTGDASVNGRAPVLCCTAEILANLALAHGAASDLRAVVMDEFHYYADAERGSAWQIPLLTLPGARFLLMSATLGTTDFFERDLTRVTRQPTVTIRSDRRPVPLAFEYSDTPLTERVADLLLTDRVPVYLVYFTQRDASEAAQSLVSLPVCNAAEKAALQAELEKARFSSPYGKEVRRWLRHGIGVHHAGLLPRYRILVEQLAQKGLLKIICGTDTLGVGINVPIRTVLFTQLWKYDGRKAAVLSVRDFRQISGRAGRRGFDDQGYVIAQAPEHVIENKRAEARAAGDPKKQKKLVKQRPAEGSISWDAATFQRLQTAPPEELSSRFEITHGLLLLVLSRPDDGCRALRALIADCHEPARRKSALRARAWQLFRALLDRRIVTWIPPEPSGRKLRVNVALQDDFSLHQALSLYLLDTLPLLDRLAPDYALDVLTLCEAIVEDPDQILRRQVDRAKTEKLEEMRAAGIPYEERMAKLEEIEHPKPRREFLYDTFNAFAAAHPWVEGENVRPKSIAREMYERYQSFGEYVREYGLQRSEGLLLRTLSQVWKVLSQTVPVEAKTEPVLELEEYFRELIRGIDSSLLEEWERLLHPDATVTTDDPAADKPARPASYDFTRDQVGFRRATRTAIFGFLQDVAAQDWESAVSRLADGQATVVAENTPLSPAARAVADGFAGYFEARGRFRLDPAGRAAPNTTWAEVGVVSDWDVAQMLIDPDDQNDWQALFRIDWPASRTGHRAVLSFVGVEPLG